MIYIVLIEGLSGSGKTTIAKKLCQMDNKFNLIKSYTTRDQRNEFDNDHIFIKKNDLLKKMFYQKYVASTYINNNIYVAFKNQFFKNKINIYIIDDFGLLDVLNFNWEHNSKIMYIRIKSDFDLSIDLERQNRFNLLLDDSYFNYIYINNDIEKVCNKIYDDIKEFFK